jgi:transketolase
MMFLTGDLGFMALEPLRDAMGERFINAGVAEQNMVSVAAGAASVGEQCWVYSIAPFVYARPFEQIRNDVCLHDLNVKLVGNGGGYGYGVMGATHHAIEDYGILCALQHMRAYVPVFSDDVAPIVALLTDDPHPGYLRLGRCEKPVGLSLPAYAPWRCVLDGKLGILVIVGPCAGTVIGLALALPPAERPAIWLATELPLALGSLPVLLLESLSKTGALFVLEEHVAQGGAGHMLAYALIGAGVFPRIFCHFHARGYASGRYGSQAFHREENGIDATYVLASIRAAMVPA